MASNASPKPTRASLSFEEISKLFSLPIAEAASILGVCTSVLKRICRSHGILRWPYRKLVSGKAGDDSKNSISERGKAPNKELNDHSKAARNKPFTSSAPSPMSSTASSQAAAAKSQLQGVSKQNASALVSQTKGIPTFMDDFKYGFPSSGLSRETIKWWGGSSHMDSAAPAKDAESADASKAMTDDDDLDWGADEDADAAIVTTAGPSAQLCSLRRKAVDDGRKLLNGDSTRHHHLQFSRLNKKQKLLLAQVFGASLLPQERINRV